MKNKYIAALLAFLFGGLGIHRFYLGHPFSGVLYLLFVWTFIPTLLSLCECVYYLFISERKFNERYNQPFVMQMMQQYSMPNDQMNGSH